MCPSEEIVGESTAFPREKRRRRLRSGNPAAELCDFSSIRKREGATEMEDRSDDDKYKPKTR